MGFDIFLQAAEKDVLFDRAIVERAFESIAIETASDWWNLRAPDGSMHLSEVSIHTDARIDGFAVHRPPWTEPFWEAMFEVMRQTRTVLIWPAGGPPPICCVANPEWRTYLSTNFIETWGAPAVVSSGAEIPGVIEASGA